MYTCKCSICGKIFKSVENDDDTWCSDKCEEEREMQIDSQEVLPK